MDSSEKNFFGTRLKLARKMAGMSLQDLSDKLQGMVAKQSLSKYELGLMRPTTEVLLAISRILRLRPDYFLKKDTVEIKEISFRKKISVSKKVEESVIEIARSYVENYTEIESILGEVNIFQNPLKSIMIYGKDDVKIAAEKLRKSWNLGSDPIPNIVEMLELRGVKVQLIDYADEIDGVSILTSDGNPVVVINVKAKPIERVRFTVIHELAHVILKFDEKVAKDSKEVETLCHYFSSCFILPEDQLIKMIGGRKRSYISINELIYIKEYYGISIRAIVHRLRELDVISSSYYQRWMIYMSKTYGQKDEPGVYKGEEKQRVFKQLVNRALSEGLISISKAAALLGVDINELRKGYNGHE